MSAREYSTEQAEHYKNKADHNKKNHFGVLELLCLVRYPPPF